MLTAMVQELDTEYRHDKPLHVDDDMYSAVMLLLESDKEKDRKRFSVKLTKTDDGTWSWNVHSMLWSVMNISQESKHLVELSLPVPLSLPSQQALRKALLTSLSSDMDSSGPCTATIAVINPSPSIKQQLEKVITPVQHGEMTLYEMEVVNLEDGVPCVPPWKEDVSPMDEDEAGYPEAMDEELKAIGDMVPSEDRDLERHTADQRTLYRNYVNRLPEQQREEFMRKHPYTYDWHRSFVNKRNREEAPKVQVHNDLKAAGERARDAVLQVRLEQQEQQEYPFNKRQRLASRRYSGPRQRPKRPKRGKRVI